MSNAPARGRRSAGIVLWRRRGGDIEVLLGHMGGPYWARKDRGAWTIPKGEVEAGEEPLAVAVREFAEELGVPVPAGQFVDLGEVRQSGGKIVRAWSVEGDFDPETMVSNTFELEWPPRSGRMQAFPEIDRAAWFDAPTARIKVVTGQRALIDRVSASA
jgi:predicted NUDIX family NTP pyrophosphohydrolase